MKIETMRFIDSFLVRPLIWLISLLTLFRRAKETDGIKKILIIRPGGIGDAVCTLPFIKELKMLYPHAEISILAMPRNKEIFENCSSINHVFIFEENKALNPFYLLRFLKALKNQNFDVVFDLEQWYRFPALVSWILGDKIRVGYATNEKKFLYTQKITYYQNRYEVLSFLDQLAGLDKNITYNHKLFLFIPKEANTFAASFLKYNKFKKFIVIAPAAYKREKMWPEEKYVELINHLTNKFQIILLGGLEDANMINSIASKIDKKEKIISIAGEFSLMQCAALIKKARLFIGGDTGLMHIAAAVGMPTISLFGPTIKEKWAPKGNKHNVISKKLGCSPCAHGLFAHIPKCKKGVECMSNITVKEVLDKINLALRK